MSVEFANRGIVRDGLVYAIDAFSNKSHINGSTEVFDLTKNRNTGTLINGITSDGFSLGFNGSNQWVDFLSGSTADKLVQFDYGDPFSVEFWVKKQTGVGFDWVIGRQGIQGFPSGNYTGWSVLYRSSPLGSLGFGLSEYTLGPSRGLAIRTTNIYNDDTYKHHVCVYDGGTTIDALKIYTDTVLDIPITLTDNYEANSIVSPFPEARTAIGRRYDESGNYPEMDLRVMNIYNKALSEGEIKRNYYALKEKVYGS